MRFLTDFADQAVLLPLVFAVALTLALQGWRRGAIAWLAIMAITFGTTLGLKFVTISCMPVFSPLDVRSPSGHVAAATVVAGALLFFLTRRRESLLPAACAAALAIGISRLALGMHSLPEVMIGAAIGVGGAAGMLRFAGRPPPLRWAPLVAVIVIVAGVFHGLHLPAEAAIHRTAYGAADFIPACRSPSTLPTQAGGP